MKSSKILLKDESVKEILYSHPDLANDGKIRENYIKSHASYEVGKKSIWEYKSNSPN